MQICYCRVDGSGELGLDAIAGDVCVGFAGIHGLFVFGRLVDWHWNFIQRAMFFFFLVQLKPSIQRNELKCG